MPKNPTKKPPAKLEWTQEDTDFVNECAKINKGTKPVPTTYEELLAIHKKLLAEGR